MATIGNNFIPSPLLGTLPVIGNVTPGAGDPFVMVRPTSAGSLRQNLDARDALEENLSMLVGMPTAYRNPFQNTVRRQPRAVQKPSFDIQTQVNMNANSVEALVQLTATRGEGQSLAEFEAEVDRMAAQLLGEAQSTVSSLRQQAEQGDDPVAALDVENAASSILDKARDTAVALKSDTQIQLDRVQARGEDRRREPPLETRGTPDGQLIEETEPKDSLATDEQPLYLIQDPALNSVVDRDNASFQDVDPISVGLLVGQSGLLKSSTRGLPGRQTKAH